MSRQALEITALVTYRLFEASYRSCSTGAVTLSSPNSKKLPGVTLLLHLDAFEDALTMHSSHHRQEDVEFLQLIPLLLCGAPHRRLIITEIKLNE